MATDEDDGRYATGDSRPADEDLSPAVREFIYGKPDELPELPDPPGDSWDPLLDEERIRLRGDGE